MKMQESFLQTAIDRSGGRIALVIGNGIHRHKSITTGNDWNGLVQSLAIQHGLKGAASVPSLALTELFDLIDLTMPQTDISRSLQEEFCRGMIDWRPAEHHCWIAEWAVANKAPVLTTNFDNVLGVAVGAKLQSMFERRGSLKAPTDFYPWEKYYGLRALGHPCADFGVWHINGMLRHTRSIKLGLTDYMGAVSRARPWLHGTKETRLFSEKNRQNWRGRNTWLHIVFNMPLLIFGLGLGAEEVFMRWLLIERARYFRQFPYRKKPAWYVHNDTDRTPEDAAKYFFLGSIGITPIGVKGYDAIYDRNVWNSEVI